MRATPSTLSAAVLLVLLACSDSTGPSQKLPGVFEPEPPERGTFQVIPAAATLQAGQSRQFNITYTGAAALSASDLGAAWRSSNEDVATVSSRGLVHAVGGGHATITATWGGHQATALVTVDGPMKKHENPPVCLSRDHGALKPQC